MALELDTLLKNCVFVSYGLERASARAERRFRGDFSTKSELRNDLSSPASTLLALPLLLPVAVALTIGAGNFQITMGNFTLSAIGVATIAAIVLYQVLREKEEPEEQAVEVGPEG